MIIVEPFALNEGVLEVDLSDGNGSSTVLADQTEVLFGDHEIRTIQYLIADDKCWTSLTLATIRVLDAVAGRHGVNPDYSALPSGAAKVVALAQKITTTDKNEEMKPSFDLFESVGERTLQTLELTKEAGVFLQQSGQSVGRFITGRAQYQRSDLAGFIQSVGPQAIPIVGLVNLLLGVILAFMGAIQLQQFGAQIYVADLVALGLTREIGPMMTAIILAGRTGAAYAAQLGTMQVNEEIDALRTFGFSPMDFLVLPRMVALAIMTPLLVLYADAIGVFGGFLVGTLLLDISAVEYITQTQSAIDLTDIGVGIIKGSIFGILVAITGCMQGMRSGRSASAVGDAATSAVVSGIVAIILATALFAVLTNLMGI